MNRLDASEREEEERFLWLIAVNSHEFNRISMCKEEELPTERVLSRPRPQVRQDKLVPIGARSAPTGRDGDSVN